MQIEEGRFQGMESSVADVQEARTAWSTQVLAPRGRQDVTADPPYVDGRLSD